LAACLYLHAKCLAPILQIFRPKHFEDDLKFVRHLGQTTGRWDAQSEILIFQDVNRGGNYLRRVLRFRASGFKASVMAGQILESVPD
jgi:hypothetical protein